MKRKAIWALMAVWPDGVEGPVTIAGAITAETPMITTDEKNVAKLRDIARALVENGHPPITLVKFSAREELERFE